MLSLRSALLFLLLPASGLAVTDPATSDKDYKPLTAKERTDYLLRETIASPGIYFASFGSAIGEQTSNKPPEWKQGAKGYFHRVGSQFGAFAISRTIDNAGAAALGYDPRYIRSGNKGFPKRFAHAIAWSFLTYDGKRNIRFNAPVVAGAYGGAMISTLWYPDRFSPLRDGFRKGNIEIGVHVGVNVIKEFSPELKRVFRKK